MGIFDNNEETKDKFFIRRKLGKAVKIKLS